MLATLVARLGVVAPEEVQLLVSEPEPATSSWKFGVGTRSIPNSAVESDRLLEVARVNADVIDAQSRQIWALTVQDRGRNLNGSADQEGRCRSPPSRTSRSTR